MKTLLIPQAAIFFVSIAGFYLQPSDCNIYDDYKYCSQARYNCGDLKNISYPFWSNNTRPDFCGRHGFDLTCNNENNYSTIKINSLLYYVQKIDQPNHKLTIARSDIFHNVCPDDQELDNTTLDHDLFDFAPHVINITLFYGCVNNPDANLPTRFTCSSFDYPLSNFFLNDIQLRSLYPSVETAKCSINFSVPIFSDAIENNENETAALETALDRGFDVVYHNMIALNCNKCESSGGVCGSNSTSPFLCICPSGDIAHSDECSHPPSMPPSHQPVIMPPFRSPSDPPLPPNSAGFKKNNWSKLGAGLGTGALVIFICVIVIYRFRHNVHGIMVTKFMWKSTKNEEDLNACIRSHESSAIKRYRFSDINKITNSLKDKLGQGGYGSVYKGKLSDGRDVAVKVLNTSKESGQDFINEVLSISKTSHVNIVTLLGFCLEGQKRALIYEFMPNGSLEKFIYKKDENMLQSNLWLGWEKLLEIAIGIARGLEYLHRGCNTQILHFDIKPHNILLDEDFCPKISDFGLARHYPRKQSIVSMSGARGTIGYIAPEVFNRRFGKVSHKSDVYSYGMMILEMIGGKENPNVEESHSSDLFFPDYIYKHLDDDEHDNPLGMHGNMTRNDSEILRKMILVGLWCIQTIPLDRPSIKKVIEMLEGSTVHLQIPPKPYLFSPPRSAGQDLSTNSSSKFS